MFTKQCKFREEGDEKVTGGIYVKNGNDEWIICGCCGGVIPLDEVEWYELFDDWVDIEYEIRGE